MNKMMITGAAGKLGGLTIEHLLHTKGVPANQIIALVRDEKKAEHLSRQGIEVRVASYDDFEALQSAFKNVDKLLFISSPELDNAKRLDQNHKVVMAAKAAQVGHVVHVSLANPELRAFGLEDVEVSTEHAILAVGLPVTIMRNSTYLDEFAPDLKAALKHGELLSSTNGVAFNYVLRNDLALANATVLTEEGHEGKTYELVRSQLITFSDMASALSRVADKEISYSEKPSSVTIEKLIESGMRKGHAESLVNSFHKAVADGKFLSTSSDLETLLGDKVTPLDEAIKSLVK